MRRDRWLNPVEHVFSLVQCVQKFWFGAEIRSFLEIFSIIFGQKSMPARASGSFHWAILKNSTCERTVVSFYRFFRHIIRFSAECERWFRVRPVNRETVDRFVASSVNVASTCWESHRIHSYWFDILVLTKKFGEKLMKNLVMWCSSRDSLQLSDQSQFHDAQMRRWNAFFAFWR